MTSTFVVSFDLDTTDTTVVLGFEAWIDDKKFHDIDHVAGRQQILIEIPDDEAEHELLLIMKNKTIEHTQIDEAGGVLSVRSGCRNGAPLGGCTPLISPPAICKQGTEVP